jgi:DNA mismatch endonuclease (patch repair protein)
VYACGFSKIEANIAPDRHTDRPLREQGWTVLRVWEQEAIDVAVAHIARTIHSSEHHRQKLRP